MKLIQKKKVDEVKRSQLTELKLTGKQRQLFSEGISLFNRGNFWQAHEAWEGIWRERDEESRIFFQGIIQAAAGFYRVAERPGYVGAVNNLEKSLEKLDLFSARFLGVNVENLRKAMKRALEEARRLGPNNLDKFSRRLIPKIEEI